MIQERSTGRSRGFGYVTFVSVEDAKVSENLDSLEFRFCSLLVMLFWDVVV